MSMSAVHPIAEHAGPVPGGAATLWMSGRAQHRRAPALQAPSAPSRHRCPGSAPYRLRLRSHRTGLRSQPAPVEPSAGTHPDNGCLSDQPDGVMDIQALRNFATLRCGGALPLPVPEPERPPATFQTRARQGHIDGHGSSLNAVSRPCRAVLFGALRASAPAGCGSRCPGMPDPDRRGDPSPRFAQNTNTAERLVQLRIEAQLSEDRK